MKLLLPFNLWLTGREKSLVADTLRIVCDANRAADSKKFFLPKNISGRFSEKSIRLKSGTKNLRSGRGFPLGKNGQAKFTKNLNQQSEKS